MLTLATTVSDFDVTLSQCPNPSVLIGPSFKSFIFAGSSSDSQNDSSNEFQVDLKNSYPINTVFILNRCNTKIRQDYIRESHLRLGNDGTPYSDNNAIVWQGILDGGFFKLDKIVTGRYLTFRRDGQNTDGSAKLNLHEIKVYQMPNLFQEFSAKVTADSSQALPGF